MPRTQPNDDDPATSPLLVWNGLVTRMRWVDGAGAEGRSGNLTSLLTARPSEARKPEDAPPEAMPVFLTGVGRVAVSGRGLLAAQVQEAKAA